MMSKDKGGARMERDVTGVQTPAGDGPGPTGKDEFRPFGGTIYATEDLDKPVPDFKDCGTNKG